MWVRRQVRYVVEKRNRGGTVRLYWQRAGFPTRRIYDADLVDGGLVDMLNDAADRGDQTAPAEYGTIAWAIDRYRTSPKFAKRAATTRRIYERWLRALDNEVGDRPLAHLTPQAVYEIIDGIDSRGGKVHCAAVLSKIAKVGMKHGLLMTNPASALELEGPNRRDQIWPAVAQQAFLAACDGAPDGLGLRRGFLVLRYTAQRPGDMRRMAWSHYDGDVIRVRQQKTGALLDIPCHAVLRAELDSVDRQSPVIVTRDNGRPFSEAQWIDAFRGIMAAAGIEGLQGRDLRRSAIVELGTLGVEIQDIAAVSGHSITRTQDILEVYLPRNVVMARRAIRRWEAGS